MWHSAAMINTPCTVKNYGYATDPANTGRNLVSYGDLKRLLEQAGSAISRVGLRVRQTQDYRRQSLLIG